MTGQLAHDFLAECRETAKYVLVQQREVVLRGEMGDDLDHRLGRGRGGPRGLRRRQSRLDEALGKAERVESHSRHARQAKEPTRRVSTMRWW